MSTSKPPDTSSLLSVIGDIYDCALNSAHWPETLQRVASLVDGASVAVTLNSIANPGFDMRAKWNIDPGFEAAMLANYPVNPLVPMIWYLGECDCFAVLSEMPEDELKRTLFCRNTMAVYGIRDSVVGILAKGRSHFGSISVQRRADQEAFSPADVHTVRLLAPHLRRAVMIAETIDQRTSERDQLHAILDMISVGVVLLDQNESIVHANREATRLLDEASALRRDRDQLTATHAQSAAELRTAIASAAQGITLNIAKTGIVVSVRNSSGPELAAWVLPLDGGLRRDLGASYQAKAAVFIRVLGDTSPVPAELFVRRYAITPAECRVLLLVVQGMTVQTAAATLGVSVETARTHLKNLLAKTGTQRQAELVRLAMSALAPASN